MNPSNILPIGNRIVHAVFCIGKFCIGRNIPASQVRSDYRGKRIILRFREVEDVTYRIRETEGENDE